MNMVRTYSKKPWRLLAEKEKKEREKSVHAKVSPKAIEGRVVIDSYANDHYVEWVEVNGQNLSWPFQEFDGHKVRVTIEDVD